MPTPRPSKYPAFPDVVVSARGRIADLEIERIGGAVGRLLARHGVTSGARVRVTGANCDDGPMLVQVNLRVRDTPTRIQTMVPGKGVVLPAVDRLDKQISRLSGPWQPWTRSDPTRSALATPGEGTIARRKPYALARADVGVAVASMDAMDYDVHLFTDAETGEDAIVYRAAPLGLRLTRQRHQHLPRLPKPPAALSLTVSPRPPPVLSEDTAVERLCEHGLPFLFFTDPADGRGHLLYRRYDGDLGLISPNPADRAI
ncbi:sigma 54 modulation/S30EA ribosomal C-terminal domain-containing protein [Nocardia sp. CA-119907]|uniref:sigma 54 modulation/S30EA ribosomal C-terminal domain-containing protein n=1 Tax=Nocardia sp. CA-119907 TaxID=3239973 RepID=UPI003D990483